MKTPSTAIEHGSTIFLRGVVLLIGLIVLALCVFALPAGITSDNTGMYRPLLLAMYIPAIPFFIAMYQTLKLLGYIDRNKAFSKLSIKSLMTIKYSATGISLFYTLLLPYVYYVADKDDAPGVVLIGMLLAFSPMVVAVFAATLQKLLQNAMDIKAENDLTV